MDQPRSDSQLQMLGNQVSRVVQGVSSAGLPILDLSSTAALPADVQALVSGQTAAPSTEPSRSGHAEEPERSNAGTFWLAGETVLCACPECQAPMSVRLWLMVADCWQCDTSIELTEEQEREIHRLLDKRKSESKPQPSARLGPPARADAPTRPSKKSPVHKSPNGTSTARPAAATAPRRVPAAQRPVTARIGIHQTVPWGRPVRDWLRDLPAWFVSLAFHVVLLTLLALLDPNPDEQMPGITLSLAVGHEHRQGDQPAELVDQVRFDLPIPDQQQPTDPNELDALMRADQEARPLRLDPNSDNPHLPNLRQVKSTIVSSDTHRRTLATRDPRLRTELIRQEGGTTLTEAAVARGLRWLAHQQRTNGSWNLRDGGARSAGTALALLPFLGAGQTHLVGPYRQTVSDGIRFLVRSQHEDGDLRGDSPEPFGMYTQGQAAIVLCEAYAITQDESLRQPAQRAIDFVVTAQYPRGGWRYLPRHEARPGERRGDTSVLGWQLMALQSARAAGLDVPHHVLELSDQFLDTVQHDGGARYGYQTTSRPTHTMTAEALLCRMYLGWRREQPGLLEGIDFLLDEHMPSVDEPNVYYWYYATQAIHHLGGDRWETWNENMREVLIQTQRTQGRHAGSWDPDGPHGRVGGRVYVTSLAVCTLEVYYRHAPIFRQIKLD